MISKTSEALRRWGNGRRARGPFRWRSRRRPRRRRRGRAHAAPFDLRDGSRRSRRRIGVAHHDELRARSEELVDRERKVGRVGYGVRTGALDPGEGVVKAVGGDRVGDRPTAWIDARAKQHRKKVVRPIARDDLIRQNAIHVRRLAAEVGRVWIGVEPELVTDGVAQRFHHSRRGRIRIFVRIQLDVPSIPWLLARNVPAHRTNDGTKKGATLAQGRAG